MKKLLSIIILCTLTTQLHAQLTTQQITSLVYRSTDSARRYTYTTADSIRKENKALAFRTADSVRKEFKALAFRTADSVRKEFKALLKSVTDSVRKESIVANSGQSDSILQLFLRSLEIDTVSLMITADKRLAVNPKLFADINGNIQTFTSLFLQYYDVDSILNNKLSILSNTVNALQKNNSPTRDEFNIEKSFLDKLRSGSTSVQIKPL